MLEISTVSVLLNFSYWIHGFAYKAIRSRLHKTANNDARG